MLLQCCNCVLHCWMTAYLLMCNRVSHLARCTLSLTGAARGHRPPLRSEVRGQRSAQESLQYSDTQDTNFQPSQQQPMLEQDGALSCITKHLLFTNTHSESDMHAFSTWCMWNHLRPPLTRWPICPNTADIHTRRERSSAVTVCAATCLNQQPSLTPTVVPLQCNHLSKHTG